MISTSVQRHFRFLWIPGILCGLASLAGLFVDLENFLSAYLQSALVLLGFSVGALAIWSLHNLTGGQWGFPIGRSVWTTARALPLGILLFCPILLGVHRLYPWTDVSYVMAHPPLPDKRFYLNLPFFLIRTIFYFSLWVLLLAGLVHRSHRFKRSPTLQSFQKLENWSGFSAVVLFFSMSFAGIDWILTLEPRFYSTVWGALIGVEQLLGAFAFCTYLGLIVEDDLSEKSLNDLGNLLLMSISLWMYLEFCQYLIIWSGQIRAEIFHYNSRFSGGWQWVGGGVIALSFILPFFLLLSTKFKRNRKKLRALSGYLVILQWGMMLWEVGPSLSPAKIQLSWIHFTVPVALFTLWIFGILRLIGSSHHLVRAQNTQGQGLALEGRP